jgi:5'-nucleotidase
MGVAITRQGVRRYTDIFQKRLDPRGKTYYWLAGELLEDVTDEIDLKDGNDALRCAAIRNNYITVTPLQYNLTSVDGLTNLQKWQLNFPDYPAL